MIPKVIHYFWFGRGKKNNLIKECIKTWKKYCPDYEIIEWNENNFDINANKFSKEAYDAKKWAFVSDYARLYTLYNYGGIYMDTDVELLKSMDNLLKNKVFMGFETEDKLSTAIIGAEKNNKLIKKLLSYYDEKSFYTNEGKFDTKTNVEIISEILKDNYKIKLDGTYQDAGGILKIYPKDFFSPKDYMTGEIELTNNTRCIHHFNASWHSKIEKKIHNKKIYYIKKYGKDVGEKKFNLWYKRSKLEIHIKKYGLIKMIKSFMKKVVCFFAKIIYGNNLVLLESLNGMDGNTGAIYNYMLNNPKFKHYKFIWFVREKKEYHRENNKRTFIYQFDENSMKKNIFHNIAKYILFDNIPIPKKNNNQKVIYLTHGTPILKNVKGIINVPDYVDSVLCTSEEMIDVMSYQFSADKNKMVICGLPRNDYLYKKDKKINSLYDETKYKKVLIWLPTFRKAAFETRNDSDKDYNLGIPLIQNIYDFERLNEYLESINFLLIIKTHPGQDNNIIKIKTMSNIIFATQDIIQKLNIELYSLLAKTDALLTDYSSVAFDYMLLDKPIGYIIDDIKQYKLGFAFEDIQKMMPGNKIENIYQLYDFINGLVENEDSFKEERREISKITNKYNDDKNCERFIDLFKI